jgi:transcriptional regulator with XRE-family HTH domain
VRAGRTQLDLNGCSSTTTTAGSPAADQGWLSCEVGRRRLGTRLRELRQAKGMPLDEPAGRLGVAVSTLSRIENGLAPTRQGYLALLLDIYDVTDAEQKRQLARWAQDGQARGWWADYGNMLHPSTCQYLGLEAAATAIRVYSPTLIPDLLQTRDYANAVARATTLCMQLPPADQLAAATMHRQTTACKELALHVIIDEAALRAVVGSNEVMTDQVRRLSLSAAEPDVTIQVLPTETPRPVICPAFTIMSFAADPDAAFTGMPYGPVTFSKTAETRAASEAFANLVKAALPARESVHLLASPTGPPQEPADLRRPSDEIQRASAQA